ncbi:ParA family protein [Microbacterium invictum]|uniref:Chromosome partitioning protein n=1 Tax=Microbacterium invictum TaxID=515415 RepID=A0AA40SR68_9MICO|nr:MULTISPECIES: ParA family protein [Microbacterium]MBB4140757.1 chromosome partitioning protein [Microbacterium invictum]
MHTIAVANQKGGVGKTTVAMQLAASLSRRFQVLMLDVDPQQSTVWWAENAGDQVPFDFAGWQRPGILNRLDKLGVDYDFVIVDTPGSLEDTRILASVLDAADYVIVPVAPEPLAVEPTLRTIHRLIEPRQVRYAVLLNKVDPRVPGQIERWHELLDVGIGLPRFAEHLRLYKAHADAPVMGQLVTNMRDNRSTTGLISDVTRLGYEVADQVTGAGAGVW